MFNSIGVGEIIVIAVVALIFLGPEKFPEFSKIAMRAFRDLRGYVDDIKKEMASELNPVKKEINELARRDPEEYLDKLTGAVTAAVDDEPESNTSSDQQDQQPQEETADTVSTDSTQDTPAEPEPYKYED